MKILLTGANGQVGWELQRTLSPLGELVAFNRREMDLADPDSVRDRVREIRPGLIVNAAAYTAVDQAEAEPDLAIAINGIAPGILAEEAHRMGATLVHYSTDYVFDGAQDGAYVEEDSTNALNVYGRSKLAGESAIREARVPHLIFRTGWVYSRRGKNFMLTILRLAGERDELRIIDDQVGAPTWSRMIAEATAQVLAQFVAPGKDGHGSLADASGIYHLTAADRTSWYGFANAIIEQANAGAGSPVLRARRVVPIKSSEYPLPAARPKNSVLSNEKLWRKFGIVLPDWTRSLKMCLGEPARR